MTEPDRILGVAEAELEHTRRLIREHIAVCTVPRLEPGSLTGECPECKSLASHLMRCEEQVRLLGTEAETEALF